MSVAERGDIHGRTYKQISRGAARAMDAALDVAEWTDEELKRGQRKPWRGAPPRIIPAACHRELMRRWFSDANMLLTESVPDAVRALVAIATSEFAEDRDVLKAVDLIMNRAMGKPIERVEVAVTGDPPWLEALQAGIVDVDTKGNVIETTATEVRHDATTMAYDDDDDIILDD